MDISVQPVSFSTPLRAYLMLAKPGIILGNVITAAAGFALASKGSLNGSLLLVTLAGLSFIIASACVCNNYIDRYADEKMQRTKRRPLVTGAISTNHAICYALILGASGTIILSVFTNAFSLWAALLGFAIYVFLYSFWKYRTSHATLIGSIAGAMPPIVGYCAVSGSLNIGAVLLFFIIAAWQMPHFLAIALYRQTDYAAASIPVLPVERGVHTTKIQLFFYTIAFAVAAISPAFFQLTGGVYLIVALCLGLSWIGLSIQGFRQTDDRRWARQMFFFSLLVIMVLSSTIIFF